jgi:hypothetical protein
MMPRTFDFDNKNQDAKQKAYDEGQTFPYLTKKRRGKKEADLSDLHGPHGLFLFDGENHQFKRVAKDGSAYRNQAADEIFDWLDNNVQGRWHWLEISSNHGHSVSTRIWVEGDVDAQVLRKAFPDKLDFDEKQHAENQEIRTKFVTGVSGLHPALNPGFLSHMIQWNDDESRRYIASIGDKPGFPKVFAGSIGKLREKGKIDENALLDRLTGMIDGLIPAEGREPVIAYLNRARTPFVDALFERLQSTPVPRL